MKINLQLLYLVAAILRRDPLEVLVDSAIWLPNHIEDGLAQIGKLERVMPEELIMLAEDFLVALANNRGGSFQFIYQPKAVPPDETQEAIAKWIKLLRKDTEWLNSESNFWEGDKRP